MKPEFKGMCASRSSRKNFDKIGLLNPPILSTSQTYYLLLITYYLRSRFPLSIVNCQLSIVNCPLSIVHCPLSAIAAETELGQCQRFPARQTDFNPKPFVPGSENLGVENAIIFCEGAPNQDVRLVTHLQGYALG